MLRLVIVATLVAFVRTAGAGVCLGPEEADADMKLVEAYAKDKSKLKDAQDAYAFLCVMMDAKRLKPRVEAACRKILARDGETNDCMMSLANAGFQMFDSHDVVDWVMKHYKEDPIESSGGVGPSQTQLLAATNDPRALKYIVDTWKDSIPRADKREKAHREMASWSGWRQRAAAAIGDLGGADEVAFLEEQAKATKDTHVAEACRDGITAIKKRVAKP